MTTKPAKASLPDGGAAEEGRVSAEPTKDLFISMLVKDIELPAAIMDLVDNSVDGARRLKGNGPYRGLSIGLTFNRRLFELQDNCGGIPRNLETYAFRFGRPRKMPRATQVKHSVGQFGIGMKRGLFKMGNRFTVESESEDSRFSVKVNVPEWAEEDGWTFPFRRLRPRAKPQIGTTITVEDLFLPIADRFDNPLFESELVADIALRHQESLSHGLVIRVNNNPVVASPLAICSSAAIKPVFQRLPSLNGKGRLPLRVRLYCGLASHRKRSPRDAGWYVFCNGRLIVDANQTDLTGWGVGNPRFHPQFTAFRGYVFFDSDDPERLPWNTMKTSVDPETEEYAATRQVMISAMRPVIDFLNRLSAEDDMTDSGPLRRAWESAPEIALAKVKRNDVFGAPKAPPAARPPRTTSSIQYERPIAKINIAKGLLKVGTNREVGERTFDYFFRAEGADTQ